MTNDHLHAITHLPPFQMWLEIIHSAQGHSWVPSPAPRPPGLTRAVKSEALIAQHIPQRGSGHAYSREHLNETTPVSAHGCLSGELLFWVDPEESLVY